MLDWCTAVRGSRSNAGAGSEIEDTAGGERREEGEGRDWGEDGEMAVVGD